MYVPPNIYIQVTLRCENMEQFGLPSFITSYNAKPVLIRNTSSFLNNATTEARYAEIDINVRDIHVVRVV